MTLTTKIIYSPLPRNPTGLSRLVVVGDVVDLDIALNKLIIASNRNFSFLFLRRDFSYSCCHNRILSVQQTERIKKNVVSKIKLISGIWCPSYVCRMSCILWAIQWWEVSWSTFYRGEHCSLEEAMNLSQIARKGTSWKENPGMSKSKHCLLSPVTLLISKCLLWGRGCAWSSCLFPFLSCKYMTYWESGVSSHPVLRPSQRSGETGDPTWPAPILQRLTSPSRESEKHFTHTTLLCGRPAECPPGLGVLREMNRQTGDERGQRRLWQLTLLQIGQDESICKSSKVGRALRV